MKKTGIILLILLTASAVFGQKKPAKMPPPEQMKYINDSILTEATRLYVFEKLNWWGTDEYLKHLYDKNDTRDWKSASSFTLVSNDVISVIFYKTDTCILEYRYDMLTDNVDVVEEWRPLKESEMAERDRFNTLIAACNELQIPIYTYPQDKFSFNVDMIRIDENTTRVYFMMGALENNSVGFGNDFSVDFDDDNTVLGWRSYHHSFIPVNYANSASSTLIHSHTKDNPYMTPTDLCTFMLYAYDLKPELNQLWVYSSLYKGFFLFDAKSMSINFLSSKALKKINKHQEKIHKK